MKKFILDKIRKRLKLPASFDKWLIYKFPILFFPPHMSNNEFTLFVKHTKKAKKIIEFGSGGSTFYFLNKNKTLFSIENNKPFLDYLNSFEFIKKNLNKNLIFIPINIGESKDWGIPYDESYKKNWPTYYNLIWENQLKGVDIIFIDGRFRVMCALTAIHHINKSTLIIIHDFLNREHYHCILDFYNIIEKADSMVILQIRDDINWGALNSIQKSYKYDYR